jgi:hypothetical protein
LQKKQSFRMKQYNVAKLQIKIGTQMTQILLQAQHKFSGFSQILFYYFLKKLVKKQNFTKSVKIG